MKQFVHLTLKVVNIASGEWVHFQGSNSVILILCLLFSGGTLKVSNDLFFKNIVNFKRDRWMTCDFTSFFNNVSVISGRWADDYERLCAMEPPLRLLKSLPQAGLELTTARSVGQRLIH